MIEELEAIDRSLVLWFNSIHGPWLDEFMWIVSARATWIPFYLLLIWLYYRKTGWKETFYFLGFALVVVALSDQISNHLFKDLFMRYRPSHHALLTDKLHFYKLENGDLYKGGQFGFVSSHAANFFGVCTYAWLCLRVFYRHIIYFLFGAALLVSLSRVYLGVHYMSDIIGGGLLGVSLAYFGKYLFMRWGVNKKAI